MKYTICEAFMWHAMIPSIFKWLKSCEAESDIPALKRSASKIYKQMIKRTPDIGSMSQNSIRTCLTAGMIWLSVYEASDGRMSEDHFAGIVQASMEAQQKRADNAVKGNAASDSTFNWNTEVIMGLDSDEYTINYYQCGICALARHENLFNLVPYMCAMDIMSVEWMGGVLYRTKTTAEGADSCDFYICRKGSKWDKQKQQERMKCMGK